MPLYTSHFGLVVLASTRSMPFFIVSKNIQDLIFVILDDHMLPTKVESRLTIAAQALSDTTGSHISTPGKLPYSQTFRLVAVHRLNSRKLLTNERHYPIRLCVLWTDPSSIIGTLGRSKTCKMFSDFRRLTSHFCHSNPSNLHSPDLLK